jgi:hypothetical protein
MAPKKKGIVGAKAKPKPVKKVGAALKQPHVPIVSLSESLIVAVGSEDVEIDGSGRDMKAKAMRAIMLKVPPQQLLRVMSMRVAGKGIVDLLEVEIQKKNDKGRIGSSFWTAMFRMFNIKSNPMDGLSFPGETAEWPAALVDALEDCHSDNACARGHGIVAFKCCIGEMGECGDATLWGLLNTIFTIDVARSFSNRLLLAVLQWMTKEGRMQKHEMIWKAAMESMDTALTEQFLSQGTSAKTFIMTHRFEVLAFISEDSLNTMMAKGGHLEKHSIIAKQWDHCAILRALFKDEKDTAAYAKYREDVIEFLAITCGNERIFEET